MATGIYIDGQVGTTGLRIWERLEGRDDLELLRIEEAKRKDLAERKRLLNEADVAILCLPDAASIEAVEMIEEGSGTKVMDASTAFRTDPDWVYGLPELSSAQREALVSADRVANPGCHASGFLLLTAPLVAAGLVQENQMLSCSSLTGYSGGGKAMIAEYEAEDRGPEFDGARPYALGMRHKHLPEMQALSGLEKAPIFQPVVGPFHSGMCVSVPLPGVDVGAAHSALEEHYEESSFVRVLGREESVSIDGGCLDPQALNDTNQVELLLLGEDDRCLAVARFDNLGKGASGAAVQNLNLMIGAPEERGLK